MSTPEWEPELTAWVLRLKQETAHLSPREQFAEAKRRVGTLPDHKQAVVMMIFEQGVSIGRDLNPPPPVIQFNNQTSNQSVTQNASPTATAVSSSSPPPPSQPPTPLQRIGKAVGGALKFVVTEPLKALTALAVVLVLLSFIFPQSKLVVGALDVASKVVRKAKAVGDTAASPTTDSTRRTTNDAAARSSADTASRVVP